MNPRAIIFGTGYYYRIHKGLLFSDFEIVGIVDNDEKKQGELLDGFRICSPNEISAWDYDCICVAANFRNSYEIRKQLEKMGIAVSKLRFYEPAGVPPYRIPEEFFHLGLTHEDKRKLFSENVERVILEINSKCNRKCWFCPNSFTDRFNENHEMDDALFDSILADLESIDYHYDITFSYFNEPLCSQKICNRISAIKEALPNSYLYVFSNGDYATREYLEELESAGLDGIKIDVYTNEKPGEYSREYALSETNKLIKRLQLQPNFQVKSADEESSFLVARAKIGRLNVEIFTQDFAATAANRAEALPESLPIPHISEHKRPCLKNFYSFHIAYNGNVYPCPNMHTGVEKHSRYCVGNANEESIFDIYVGEKLQEYRKKNLFERNSLPCRSCLWNFDSLIENRYNRPFRDRPSSNC